MSIATTTPMETFRAAMQRAGKEIRPDGRAQCPGHDGDGFNLAVSEGSDGTLAVYCHSHECTAEEICEGLGLSVSDLFPNGTPGRNVRTKETIDGKPTTVHATSDAAIAALAWSLAERQTLSSKDTPPDFVWDYRTADGDLVGKVVRWNLPNGGKEIRQIRRHGRGWITRGMNGPRPLYRLPEIAAAKASESTIYVCEGEKAADAVASLGLLATSPSQGSKSPHLTDWSPLNEFQVIILPDNDEPGAKFATAVLGLLKEQASIAFVGAQIRHLWDDLPTLEESGDAFDWAEYYDSATPETLQQKLAALPNHMSDYTPADVKPERKQQPNDPTQAFTPWAATSVWEAIREPLPMRQVIIDGLARRGEVMNIVGTTKFGKSWMTGGLLFSVATGRDWLGRSVTKGKALLVDNELHDETIQNRLKLLADAMNIEQGDASPFEYVSVRGEFTTLDEIQAQLSHYQAGDLTIIVMDAKYRFLDGDENSNAVQTAFHNAIDCLAKDLDCLIVLVHHSTKGEQGGKSVTDIGSGGGAQSRAVDCHLTIRPHEESENLAVLDAAVRTFAPVESQTLRWVFPQWTAEDAIEPVVKQAATQADRRNEQLIRERATAIVQMLRREPGNIASDNKLSGNHPASKTYLAALELNRSDGLIEWVSEFQPPRSKSATGGWRLVPTSPTIGDVDLDSF